MCFYDYLMWISAYIHMYKNTHAYTCTQTNTHIYICTQTHRHIHKHTHTQTHTNTHIHTHSHIKVKPLIIISALKGKRAGKMADSLRCQQCRNEDLSWAPKTHVKEPCLWHTLVIPVLGKQR